MRKWVDWARARLERTSVWSALFLAISTLLLLLPQVIPDLGDERLFRLPRIYSGDEPAYMVAITSAARDHDADLSNNYYSALRGGDDAGERCRKRLLDPHLAAGVDGRTVVWHEYYDDRRWKRRGRPTWPPPRLKDTPEPPEFRYSSHPDGIVVLLAPVWFVFAHTQYLEPAIVFCSGFAAVGLLFLLRAWIRRLTDSKPALYLSLVAILFGTPLWHYGRSIFNEIYLALFAVATYYLAFHARRKWLLGVPIALGLLMKPFFVIVGLPAFFVLRRSLLGFILASVPIGVAGVYVLVTNWMHFGSPFLFPQPSSYFGWAPDSARMLLIDAKHGLFPFTPALLVAFAGWPALLRARPLEGALPLAGALGYFGIFLFVSFDAGMCFGPRYLIPVIPLLMLGVSQLGSTFVGRNPLGIFLAALILLASISINALGALPYTRSWNQHPFTQLAKAEKPRRHRR